MKASGNVINVPLFNLIGINANIRSEVFEKL